MKECLFFCFVFFGQARNDRIIFYCGQMVSWLSVLLFLVWLISKLQKTPVPMFFYSTPKGFIIHFKTKKADFLMEVAFFLVYGFTVFVLLKRIIKDMY